MAIDTEHPQRAQPTLGRGMPRLLREFLATEASGGILLLAAAVIALVWANSPWSASYESLWHTDLTINFGRYVLEGDLHHWVNDALMVVFFFVVGLEIKHELVHGKLRDPRTAAMPALAALGGMVVPAALFLLVTAGGDGARGWGIPMATDIAFAVGVVTLLGRRVPASLKLFLLTLAIVDDIGAIAVIAVFYSDGVALTWLAGAGAGLASVVVMKRLGAARPLAYIPVGAIVWYCTYRAGIHPTIAAVAIGLLTPAGPVAGRPVLGDLEHRLHPWSSYLVVPVFALANAGVPLSSDILSDAAGSRLTWAVALGLVIGKLVGVSAASWLALRTGLGQLPSGVGFGHVVGAAGIAGIGFTVSLFITGLAFDDVALQTEAKIGILVGSAVAAVLGVFLLLRQPGQPADETGVRL